MASNYEAIRLENKARYGTDVGEYGPILLANRYDDRSHCIFELLQNAEDALGQHPRSPRNRAVSFDLNPDRLEIRHWGRPFEEKDVRGICGIAKSTKPETAIGRFGIGFKSVYAFTDRPEIHSGDEHFAIDCFVWPTAAPSIGTDAAETVFRLGLRKNDGSASRDLAGGLEGLGASSLLFLRHIEEIRWSVTDGRSGTYLRQSNPLDALARRVSVLGQTMGANEVHEEWLVFSRPIRNDKRVVGHAEIAFRLDEKSELGAIRALPRAPLVVYFPTVVETNLGFLIQGPYRTTPSRDNIPRTDPWNASVVTETGLLLTQTLAWLRDHKMLGPETLQCLPLDVGKFVGTTFSPLFEATRTAMRTDRLIPTADGRYAPSIELLLGRGKELRDLLSNEQISMLFAEGKARTWVSGEVTENKTPRLHVYLKSQLEIEEIEPGTFVKRLTGEFLQKQSDEWIQRLYEFLNGQGFIVQYLLSDIPLVRLEDGSHVIATTKGNAAPFLPGPEATGFPTIRRAVCTTDASLAFLRKLGLTQADPVDGVIRNVLPKYQAEGIQVTDAQYEADVRRVVSAYATDSQSKRAKLVESLEISKIVRVVDATEGKRWWIRPQAAYFPTEKLKSLFRGVEGVFFIDDRYDCLRGEPIRTVLEACGASRYLEPIQVGDTLPHAERLAIRRAEGLERATWEKVSEDTSLRGLESLLKHLSTLPPQQQRERAALFWDCLADLESRSGGAFSATYRWSYSQLIKQVSINSTTVRTLNHTAWVPDGQGNLQRPELVYFADTGWRSSPILESKLRFKPPVIQVLAREAGIEPGVLDLLKRAGVTTEEELRKLLSITAPASTGTGTSTGTEPIEPADTKKAGEQSTTSGSSGTGSIPGDKPSGDGSGNHTSGTKTSDQKQTNENGSSSDGGENNGTGAHTGQKSRAFVSYVATGHEEPDEDPDGLGREANMQLEAKAIDFILTVDTSLQRTEEGNEGFDLFEEDVDGNRKRWVEVKAMTRSLADRPVGMSSAQFKCARERGENYWLYVVEFAADPKTARIVQIQDPVGKARTFTFDRGWTSVARIVEANGSGET